MALHQRQRSTYRRGDIGLTFPQIDRTSPFICLPHSMTLDIIGECGFTQIYEALNACEKLRQVALSHSDWKRVFTDYGQQVAYACVRPQPSRNSKTVLNNPLFMDNLSNSHWKSLVWLMKCAEMCFRALVDLSVISHLYHAKKLVPLKTFSSTASKSPMFSSDYFGGIVFGTNVFLCCHTNADFMMSISQDFLKGKSEYHLNNDVVAYSCFPTLGVAVPICPGDYFMFNALIPYCISSRCKLEGKIMCASVYLKTAIVGMNNNDIPLTPRQSQIANQLDSYKLKLCRIIEYSYQIWVQLYHQNTYSSCASEIQ
jgi:hypothetical protein